MGTQANNDTNADSEPARHTGTNPNTRTKTRKCTDKWNALSAPGPCQGCCRGSQALTHPSTVCLGTLC
eukprot:18967-Alexandrium_andersonii.AAC.1